MYWSAQRRESLARDYLSSHYPTSDSEDDKNGCSCEEDTVLSDEYGGRSQQRRHSESSSFFDCFRKGGEGKLEGKANKHGVVGYADFSAKGYV